MLNNKNLESFTTKEKLCIMLMQADLLQKLTETKGGVVSKSTRTHTTAHYKSSDARGELNMRKTET